MAKGTKLRKVRLQLWKELKNLREILKALGCSKTSSSGKLELQLVSGWQKAVDYVKMLNDLSLAQEWCRLCEEEWIFQQDNAAIHNASITKKYLLEQKIRLLDHPACSPDLSPIENLIDCCKSLWRRLTVLGNFWTKKRNLRRMGGKNTFGSISETSR